MENALHLEENLATSVITTTNKSFNPAIGLPDMILQIDICGQICNDIHKMFFT